MGRSSRRRGVPAMAARPSPSGRPGGRPTGTPRDEDLWPATSRSAVTAEGRAPTSGSRNLPASTSRRRDRPTRRSAATPKAGADVSRRRRRSRDGGAPSRSGRPGRHPHRNATKRPVAADLPVGRHGRRPCTDVSDRGTCPTSMSRRRDRPTRRSAATPKVGGAISDARDRASIQVTRQEGVEHGSLGAGHLDELDARSVEGPAVDGDVARVDHASHRPHLAVR